MRKIAKQIIVCLFALSAPAYFVRDQPDYFPILISVGLLAFLTLVFMESPRAISWAKARLKALLVSGFCVASAGLLLIIVLSSNDASGLALAIPVIAVAAGIWAISAASVIGTFYRR